MHVHVPTRSVPPRSLPARMRRGFGQTVPTGCPQPWTITGTGGPATACVAPKAGGTVSSPSTAELAGSIAGAGASIGATILALSPVTGPAAPFVAIGGLLASFATSVLHIGTGCGATCVEATDVVNYAECIMQANINTYMQQPVHYASAQAAAMSVFTQAWNYIVQSCTAIGGEGGKGCIADRSPGGRWDYHALYYTPISNDPCVVPDPSPVDAVTGAATTAENAVSSAAAAVESMFGSSGSILIPLLIVAGMAFVLMEGM